MNLGLYNRDSDLWDFNDGFFNYDFFNGLLNGLLNGFFNGLLNN